MKQGDSEYWARDQKLTNATISSTSKTCVLTAQQLLLISMSWLFNCLRHQWRVWRPALTSWTSSETAVRAFQSWRPWHENTYGSPLPQCRRKVHSPQLDSSSTASTRHSRLTRRTAWYFISQSLLGPLLLPWMRLMCSPQLAPLHWHTYNNNNTIAP